MAKVEGIDTRIDTPKAIPKKEQWLWNNKRTFKSVQKGLQQAAQHKFSNLKRMFKGVK